MAVKGYRVFIQSEYKFYSVVGIRGELNNNIVDNSTLIITLNGSEFFNCSFTAKTATISERYLPQPNDYFPFEYLPTLALNGRRIFPYRINNLFNFNEFTRYSKIFYQYSLENNIFYIERYNIKFLDLEVYPISSEIINNNCNISPSTATNIESPLILIKVGGSINLNRNIKALEVNSSGLIINTLDVTYRNNVANISCNLTTGQHIIFIPENVVSDVDYQVLYYNIVDLLQLQDPTPGQIDPTLEITSYPDYNDTNANDSVGFNGLIKYFTNNVELTSAQLTSNTYLNGVGSNTVFVNTDVVDSIKIYPQLRTKVLYSDNSLAVVVYENPEYPISVTLIHTINHDNESTTKYENIPYNLPYTFNISNARQLISTIRFQVDEDTVLEKTILFFYLPSTLYTRLVTNNSYEFNSNEYVSLIDWTTGESAEISKWGCLLLTNEFEEIWDVEVNGITKKAAELVPTTKVRMGNLNGIYNETFGVNQPKGFGLYGESVYLTGNFYLNNGKSLVDINNDLLLAAGNIERIRQTINNLNNSLQDSLYNLTIELAGNYANSIAAIEAARTALTSEFNAAIATNSEAVFRLSKDYALWAVGNAGIAIINPNVSYNEDGSVNDITVGDGDEYLLLQGESVLVATGTSKNGRIKIVCTTTSPSGFSYPNNAYNPKDSNGNNALDVIFTIGWITQTTLQNATRGKVEYTEGAHLYVALTKATTTYSGNRTFYTNPPLKDASCDVYSFNSYLIIPGASIYSNYEGDTTLSGENYYAVKDVVISGMFVDGKFNANLIEAENLVAVGDGTRNPSFDVSNPITTNNYPTTNATKPFVVISGTTGKVTALGMNMKEAIVGDSSAEHIEITDNNGINTTLDYSTSGNQKPAIYFKNNNEIITEISSKKDNLSNFFSLNNSPTTITESTFNLGDVLIQYDRVLEIANYDTPASGFLKNKTIIYNGEYYFKDNPLAYDGGGVVVTSNDQYYSYDSLTGMMTPVAIGNYNVETAMTWYIKNNNEYDLFIPTRTSAYYKDENNNFIQNIGLINSDIGKISYVKNGNTATTFIKDFNSTITLLAGKVYEISGSCSAILKNLTENIHLLSSQIRNINNTTSKIDNDSNSVEGLQPYAEGYFSVRLTLGLYLENTLKHRIKTLTYLEEISKTTKIEECIVNKYTTENDISNINTIENVIENTPYLVKNTYSLFSDSVRFSKLICESTDQTYELKIIVTVLFLLTSKMSSFAYHNYNNYLPNINPQTPDIITDELVAGEIEGELDISPYQEDTPQNDGYNWSPLLCPISYIINPKVEIKNFSLTANIANQRTIIQGNGFLTGYEQDNHFEVSFKNNNNSIEFKKSEFIQGIGSVLSSTGLYNAFRINDSEYRINKLIPILCGTLYPVTRLQQYSSNNREYAYYNFSGYSLLSNTDSSVDNIGGPNLDTYLLTNMFKDTWFGGQHMYRKQRIIDGIHGTMYYIKSCDLYLCTKYNTGNVTVMFGNIWDKLFSRYGTNVIILITPKYTEKVVIVPNLTYNETFVYNNPVIINNSAVYKNKTFLFKTATGISDNTVNYGPISTKTTLLGLEFDCWDLKNVLNKNTTLIDNNTVLTNVDTRINSCFAIFDIIVHYIPNLL